MKRIVSFLSILLVCFSAFIFISCGASSSNNGEEKSNERFLDTAKYEYDKISTEIYDFRCQTYSKQSYSNVYIRLSSKNTEIYNYQFEDAIVVRDSDGAKYTVSGVMFEQLQCDDEKNVQLSFTTPNSTLDNNYTLNYTCNGNKYVFHLYESDSCYKENVNVSSNLNDVDMSSNGISISLFERTCSKEDEHYKLHLHFKVFNNNSSEFYTTFKNIKVTRLQDNSTVEIPSKSLYLTGTGNDWQAVIMEAELPSSIFLEHYVLTFTMYGMNCQVNLWNV